MKTRSTRLFLELNFNAFFSAMFQFRLGQMFLGYVRLGQFSQVRLKIRAKIDIQRSPCISCLHLSKKHIELIRKRCVLCNPLCLNNCTFKIQFLVHAITICNDISYGFANIGKCSLYYCNIYCSFPSHFAFLVAIK